MPVRAPLRMTFISDDQPIYVPDWVVDLDSFRRWTEADDFPDRGRICFFQDEVWIDMSFEQLFSHVLLKTEIATGLTVHARAEKLGTYFGDGARLHNDEAGISVIPDGLFVSTASRWCPSSVACVKNARKTAWTLVHQNMCFPGNPRAFN